MTAEAGVQEEGRVLSGFCQTAIGLEERANVGRPDWHGHCPGAFRNGPATARSIVRCTCACHSGDEEPRDLDAVIRAARLEREQAGMDKRHFPGTDGTRAGRADGKCKNEHDMTPENTGPGNVCRQCKRDASRRHKEKRAAKAGKQGS